MTTRCIPLAAGLLALALPAAGGSTTVRVPVAAQ